MPPYYGQLPFKSSKPFHVSFQSSGLRGTGSTNYGILDEICCFSYSGSVLGSPRRYYDVSQNSERRMIVHAQTKERRLIVRPQNSERRVIVRPPQDLSYYVERRVFVHPQNH